MSAFWRDAGIGALLVLGLFGVWGFAVMLCKSLPGDDQI